MEPSRKKQKRTHTEQGISQNNGGLLSSSLNSLNTQLEIEKLKEQLLQTQQLVESLQKTLNDQQNELHHFHPYEQHGSLNNLKHYDYFS